jgi:L-aspartate oxidase
MMETNFLIIGSGAAGLTLAVKLAEKFPKKKITVVTKAHQSESNTKYAQGGVAAVFDLKEDSFQKHIEDTLLAGDGLCDKTVVEMVIKDGPKRLRELMEWGAHFDTDVDGELNLGREGGHSEFRVIHHKDTTGNEIERALLQRCNQLKNITILPHHFAIDLITEHHLPTSKSEEISCYGAYVLDQISGSIFTIKADCTTLASGGMGQVYGHTTNPAVATGDGIAMAYRAKARIENMEFIQFHPTAFYDGNNGASFLISEAVRGFGAFLRNKNGQRFMFQYDERGELASRDIVSRAIDSEMKKSGDDCVFLDCTHLDIDEFKQHFPNIYETCLQKNINVAKDWIPVVPAAHYLCGGVVVDINGKTSLKNLFACGECSHTGLHGANRLASNSLLEALVYADRIFKYISKNLPLRTTTTIPEWDDNGTVMFQGSEDLQQKTMELQHLMRIFAGVVRNNNDLKKASLQLEKLYFEMEALYKKHKLNTALSQLRNMVNVAHLIIQQSLKRKENRGGFYNEDYNKENFKKNKMKNLIENSVKKAMDYTQYNLLFKQLAEEGRTTGEQTQEKIDYTKLNFSRTKRLDKTAEISEESIEVFKNISEKQTWLIISEPWCGDAAQTLPFLNKIAQFSENIDLKIVLRDENPELMNQFLTNGSQSIPVVIMLDENLNVLQTFGPRSKAATKLVTDYKTQHGKIDDAFKELLQVWYNEDKGVSIVNDILETVEITLN